MHKSLFGTSCAAALLLAAAPALAQSTANIETVVVTGERAQAQEVKRQAQVILDIAPLDQIRSMPDSNAAEALQRLPGISLEADTGEGRFINIRGMDADLNGTTFDGVRMTSSNPASPMSGGRAVAFDSFPAGLLGGVEVIKSLTPDMDAEGLGGVVNIQPRTIPVGQDHIIDASVAGGIEALRGSPVYKGDITVGQRFFDDKLSVIFSYGFEQDHRGIDDIEADYINDPTTVPPGTSAFLTKKAFDDVQYRWYQYHRSRQGFGGGFTYNPDANTSIYLRGFNSGYSERAEKHEFVITGLADNIQSVTTSGTFTSSGAQSRYSDITTKEDVGNHLVEFGGNTSIADTVTMDARLSWTEGYDRFPYSVNTRFSNPTPFDITYNNSDPAHPTTQALGGINLVDPALYTAATGSNSPTKNTDNEYGAVVNFSVPLPLIGEGGVFKFGGSLRERARRAQQFSADLNPVSQNLTDYVAGPDIIYYDGRYDIGPQPVFSKLLTIPQSPVTADPSTTEHDNENIYAGYAQYNTSFGDFDVLAGVRFEATKGTYRANTITTDTLGNDTITPNVVGHTYNDIFPDVSVKYQATDDLQIRAAFSTAIARPGFNQITAARMVNLQNAIPVVTQGNPDLKPTLGRNFDLTASWFLPEGGVASVGVFYKAFSDYIIPTEQTNATNVSGFVGQRVDLVSFSNAGAAHAEGVELEYNQKFEFLPDPLSDFGFEGNLTAIHSRGQIRPGERHSLPQTSPFNYNASLYYDNGPLDLKIGASYVSTNLWAVGGDSGTDLYSQPRFRLDFGGSYQITEELQLYLDIKNITNTKLEFTQTNDRNFPVQREFYDADYLLGIRVKL
ncbi:MAG TPA: TonB-dependent receptor [Rhizomicrobium sp.]|jgi:TonB-dependent receptor